MRSKNTFLLLSVVVGVLVMSVAYAAINNINLRVTGNATAAPDASNFKVAFTSNTSYSVGAGNGKATLSASGTTATMNVTGFTSAGDNLTATFNIKNSSNDLSAYLSKTISVSNTTYFTATATLGTTVLGPGESTTLKIMVKLKQTPITSNVTSTITATIIAEPVNGDYDGNTIYPS